jgi:hypothetical protein
MRRIKTRLQDNPRFANPDGSWTVEGERYLTENLPPPGTPRYESWVLGEWGGEDNACYPLFDRDVHIRPLEAGLYFPVTIIGEDYGAEHKCGVVALSIDQYNRRWLREAWGEPDKDQGKSLNLVVARFKERYKTKRGRGDPNQKFLNDSHGFATAKGGNGGTSGAPRLHRIDLMERLFYSYPGGRVPTFKEELDLRVPQGPFSEPDSPGFFIVEGCPGGEDLADEIEGYHYIYTETPKGRTKDVYRMNENLIAAMECANEEYEEGETEKDVAGPARVVLPSNTEKRTYGGLVRNTPARSYGGLGGRRG